MRELAIAAQAGVPSLLWGAPGTGKTSFVNALGVATKRHVETVIASIREPADFAGLPITTRTVGRELAEAIRDMSSADQSFLPRWAPALADSLLKHSSMGAVEFAPPRWAQALLHLKGILFLDEVSTAPPAVQAALLRVILDRTVADLTLPADTWVIAAANPPEQAAGGWDLSPPLANRFCHINWRLDSDAWIAGMVQGWPEPVIPILPEKWEEGIPHAQAMVASYIQHRPHHLLVVPDNDGNAGKAWPSPRSWSMAARLMAAVTSVNGGEDLAVGLIGGCVGTGVALEYWQWMKSLDLPNPEDLLRHPESLKLPARGDITFAILTSVVAAVVNKLTQDRWVAAWSVLEQAVKQGSADIAAAVAKNLLAKRKPEWPLPVRQCVSLFDLLQKAGITKPLR